MWAPSHNWICSRAVLRDNIHKGQENKIPSEKINGFCPYRKENNFFHNKNFTLPNNLVSRPLEFWGDRGRSDLSQEDSFHPYSFPSHLIYIFPQEAESLSR